MPIEKETESNKAVVYCRVSSTKQTNRGDGLNSQETRCREYARYKGYEVLATFSDDMSGSLATRPGMQAMLAFLRKRRKFGTVVIIDDISRLARGIEAHLKLRAALSEAGGKLESPSIEFGEDSDSILVENLLASVSQHQRQKNGEQTVNRMRARTLNGYWVFQAPVGYRYQRISGHGNMLIRDEPCASILQEALEGYASGRLESQSEFKRFLESFPEFPRDTRTGDVHIQRVREMLTRPVYAGYIEVPGWNVSLRKARHEGLISFETFNRIQARLDGSAKAPTRANISADFPLRGFVLCNDCDKPLTACWSTSKTGKKHPYYLCPTKDCASYRKSIRREELEGAFEDMVRSLRPTQQLFDLARAMFDNAWSQRIAQAQVRRQELVREAAQNDKQIASLLDRIVEATNTSVIRAYEARIAELEQRKLALAETLDTVGKPARPFEELFELAMEFLRNPCKLWDSGQLTLKRTVLRLAFAERVSYCRKSGLRTPKTALPFRLLDGCSCGKLEMARPRGLEPLTSSSGGLRSIQLSYGRVRTLYRRLPAQVKARRRSELGGR